MTLRIKTQAILAADTRGGNGATERKEKAAGVMHTGKATVSLVPIQLPNATEKQLLREGLCFVSQ